MRASPILVSVLTIAATAAGCSGTSSSGPAKPQSSATLSPSASPSTSTTGATDLTLTADVRAQLIHAQALVVRVPDSAFVRLAKGTAYYALDNSTDIYWAGASVVPSRHSIRAQVASQDEGGYNIFELQPGGTWQIFDTGLDGPDPRSGAQCPVQTPDAVLLVWHWALNTCDPPTHN